MKKFIVSITFLFILLITSTIESSAKSEISLKASDDVIQKNEEITITADIDNVDIAAHTLWIYFDSEKMECTSELENMNIIEDKIVYTWFSDTGVNKKINELLSIKFKSKQDGIASFYLIGEVYNDNGEKLEIQYSNEEVKIGEVEDKKEKEISSENNNVSSNDASLDIMRVNREGISPDFDKNIKEYYLIVDESVDKLDITAIATNQKAEVNITGNENLKMGVNKIKISVTSEDKTKKEEYVIYVTKTRNENEAEADLENLAIENYELSPEFNKDVTNYFVEVSNDTEKLNVLAIPIDTNAKVKIEGNKNLNVGKNKVIINVTAKDGITNKKYYINVNRRNEDEEKIFKEEQLNSIEEANIIMDKMNANISNEKKIENEKNMNETMEKEGTEENTEVIEQIITIVGGILALIVLGIVIIKLKK